MATSWDFDREEISEVRAPENYSRFLMLSAVVSPSASGRSSTPRSAADGMACVNVSRRACRGAGSLLAWAARAQAVEALRCTARAYLVDDEGDDLLGGSGGSGGDDSDG